MTLQLNQVIADTIVHNFNVYMEKVSYTTYDNLINLGGKTYNGEFYEVVKTVDHPQSKSLDPKLLMQTNIYLESQ